MSDRMLNLTDQEAVDLLATVDGQIQLGEEEQWEPDSMLPSLRAVRDQLVTNGTRDLPQMPGGLETDLT